MKGTVFGTPCDVHRLVLLACEHDGGRVSQAAISATTSQTGWLTVELHGPDGRLDFDLRSRSAAEMAASLASAQRSIVEEFVATQLRAG